MANSSRKAISQADKFRTDLEALYTASLLTGLNAQTITEPGWGKTKLSLNMGRQVVGEAGVLLMECNPAMQPDKVRGVTDIQAMINEGLSRRITEGTPYDPNVNIVILDEVGRLSDIAYDLLIHATNDYIRPVRPIFWGTSNFAVKGQRTEAFRDRFALNYIPALSMDELTVGQVVNNPDICTWEFNLPDPEQMRWTRTCQPTERAMKAVTQSVQALYRAIISTTDGRKFQHGLNPRRIEAWKEILFRCSCFFHQTNDFDVVHPQASRMMRFAFPVMDKEEYANWMNVTTAVVDPAGTAIEAVRAQAYNKMTEIANSANANERQAKMGELGLIKANAEAELSEFAGDERAEQAIKDLQNLFVQFAKGKA